MLDVSGSMSSNNLSSGESRIAALKSAVEQAINYLGNSDADSVNLHIAHFRGSAAAIGTYQITTNGIDNQSVINQAITDVMALQTGSSSGLSSGTKYQPALNYIEAWTGNSTNIVGTNNQKNQVLFVTDGEPAVSDNDQAAYSSTTQNIINNGFDVEALAITNSNSLSALIGIDSMPTVVNESSDLTQKIASLSGAYTIYESVGADTFEASAGDDLIFGDSLNTDDLASQKGLNLPSGSGWLTYEVLEGPEGATKGPNGGQWTREDTLNDIENNQSVRAQEVGNRSGGNDTINAGAGDDTVFGQEGNDKITGGLGADTLNGGTGSDKFIYNKSDGTEVDTIQDFNLVEDTIVFNNAVSVISKTINGQQVEFVVNWGSTTTTVTIDFNGTIANQTDADNITTSTTVAPIAIDLDGNGIEYLALNAGVVFTDQTTGESAQTTWVAPNDGLLVIDANQSGDVDALHEFVFTQWAPSAETDLEALQLVFDSNYDQVLNSNDEQWSDFALWVDANSDGVSDSGELISLDDAGVVSIGLTYINESQPYVAADGDVQVFGQSEVVFSDGSTTVADDAAFAVTPIAAEANSEPVVSDDGSADTEQAASDSSTGSPDEVEADSAEPSVADMVEAMLNEYPIESETVAQAQQEISDLEPDSTDIDPLLATTDPESSDLAELDGEEADYDVDYEITEPSAYEMTDTSSDLPVDDYSVAG